MGEARPVRLNRNPSQLSSVLIITNSVHDLLQNPVTFHVGNMHLLAQNPAGTVDRIYSSFGRGKDCGGR